MQVRDQEGKIVVNQLQLANTFYRRLLGLILHSSLQEGEGLLIAPCRGVHTCLMRFPIDVLYLDAEGLILHAFSDISPWKMLPLYGGVQQVLELPAGTLSSIGIAAGQHLFFD